MLKFLWCLGMDVKENIVGGKKWAFTYTRTRECGLRAAKEKKKISKSNHDEMEMNQMSEWEKMKRVSLFILVMKFRENL